MTFTLKKLGPGQFKKPKKSVSFPPMSSVNQIKAIHMQVKLVFSFTNQIIILVHISTLSNYFGHD